MKKILIIGSFLIIGITSHAQKIGFFNSTEVLKDNMEIKKADTALNTFLETLKSGYTYLQDEYNEKVEKLKDSLKLTDSKKTFLQQDVSSLAQRLNSFQSTATQQMTQKRNELMAPTTKKLNSVVETIAKEGKYDVIYDLSSSPVFYYNKSNDLTESIKKRFKG